MYNIFQFVIQILIIYENYKYTYSAVKLPLAIGSDRNQTVSFL